MESVGALRFRTYGFAAGAQVIVLHGGPAAIGGAAALARGLAGPFHVFEPWQRGSGAEPLTVATHVADLLTLIAGRCGDARPALVGESWGAMLALAYAAAHPQSVGAVALVGCGTFDLESRARLAATLQDRETTAAGQNPYDYAPVDGPRREDEGEPFDMIAHTETWEDMLRLQAAGVYPAAFTAIECPVLMLHGTYDPHPGSMIRANLQPYLRSLEYREWEACGHSPWIERFVRDEFFTVLRGWLGERLVG